MLTLPTLGDYQTRVAIWGDNRLPKFTKLRDRDLKLKLAIGVEVVHAVRDDWLARPRIRSGVNLKLADQWTKVGPRLA
jgi:hypothetical protein